MRITSAAKQYLKRILWKISPTAAYRLMPRGKIEFSIAIYTGKSPFDLMPAPTVSNPVLTRADIKDVPVGTVADPFMLRVGGSWYMFFELTNQILGKGEIGLATSEDGFSWQFEKIVLSEPYHMSYPYVFEWHGDYYMVPETGRAQSVRLYKADTFPLQWSYMTTLLEGSRFVDSSIFRFDNMWWLLTDAGENSKSPTLQLYFAADLVGPWTEHPRNPLANRDPCISRPGGRVIIVDGNPYRFAQNVFPVYGTEVRAFQINKLTTTDYSETQVGSEPIIGPGAMDWNRHGMHHIDPHLLENGTWLACVDGCRRRDFDESQLIVSDSQYE